MRRSTALLLLCGCRLNFDLVPGDDVPGDGSGGAACSRTVQVVPPSGAADGVLATGGTDTAGSCGGEGIGDLLFGIDVPSGAQLMAATDGPDSAPNTVLYVRTDCDDPATEIVCNRDSGIAGFSAARIEGLSAGRYYVFFDGDAGETGTVDGTIQLLLPDGAACTGDATRDRCGSESHCDAVTKRCVPSACTVAEMFTTAGTYNRTVTTMPGLPSLHGATRSDCTSGGDNGVRAPEAVYRVQLAATATLRVSTASTQTDFDTLVYVRDGCTGAEMGCDDDSGSSVEALTSDLTLVNLPAGDYYIFVDGFSTNTGSADLTITF
ncbi:MAG TPA: PPC domain-containing protein [Kofleriaceae bacterium]|nr:PPC domain-containing protein [Kofleriaceae bacterium]